MVWRNWADLLQGRRCKLAAGTEAMKPIQRPPPVATPREVATRNVLHNQIFVPIDFVNGRRGKHYGCKKMCFPCLQWTA